MLGRARLAAALALIATAITSGAEPRWRLTRQTRLNFYAAAVAHDADGGSLFLSSKDGLYSIDLASMRVGGAIAGVSGAGSVAVSPAHGEIYVLALHDDVLRVVDIASRRVARTFPAPAGFNVFVDASTSDLYYLRADTPTVRVASRVDGRELARITLDGAPSFVLRDPARHRLLVRLADRDLIQVIDTRERAVAVSWPMASEGQSAMGLDERTGRVFASDGRRVVMLDGASGKPLGRFGAGDAVRSIAVDAATGAVAALWGGSRINIARVHDLGIDLQTSVDTHTLVRQLFLDPRSHRLYALATADDARRGSDDPNAPAANALRVSAILTLEAK